MQKFGERKRGAPDALSDRRSFQAILAGSGSEVPAQSLAGKVVYGRSQAGVASGARKPSWTAIAENVAPAGTDAELRTGPIVGAMAAGPLSGVPTAASAEGAAGKIVRVSDAEKRELLAQMAAVGASRRGSIDVRKAGLYYTGAPALHHSKPGATTGAGGSRVEDASGSGGADAPPTASAERPDRVGVLPVYGSALAASAAAGTAFLDAGSRPALKTHPAPDRSLSYGDILERRESVEGSKGMQLADPRTSTSAVAAALTRVTPPVRAETSPSDQKRNSPPWKHAATRGDAFATRGGGAQQSWAGGRSTRSSHGINSSHGAGQSAQSLQGSGQSARARLAALRSSGTVEPLGDAAQIAGGARNASARNPASASRKSLARDSARASGRFASAVGSEDRLVDLTSIAEEQASDGQSQDEDPGRKSGRQLSREGSVPAFAQDRKGTDERRTLQGTGDNGHSTPSDSRRSVASVSARGQSVSSEPHNESGMPLDGAGMSMAAGRQRGPSIATVSAPQQTQQSASGEVSARDGAPSSKSSARSLRFNTEDAPAQLRGRSTVQLGEGKVSVLRPTGEPVQDPDEETGAGGDAEGVDVDSVALDVEEAQQPEALSALSRSSRRNPHASRGPSMRVANRSTTTASPHFGASVPPIRDSEVSHHGNAFEGPHGGSSSSEALSQDSSDGIPTRDSGLASGYDAALARGQAVSVRGPRHTEERPKHRVTFASSRAADEAAGESFAQPQARSGATESTRSSRKSARSSATHSTAQFSSSRTSRKSRGDHGSAEHQADPSNEENSARDATKRTPLPSFRAPTREASKQRFLRETPDLVPGEVDIGGDDLQVDIGAPVKKMPVGQNSAKHALKRGLARELRELNEQCEALAAAEMRQRVKLACIERHTELLDQFEYWRTGKRQPAIIFTVVDFAPLVEANAQVRREFPDIEAGDETTSETLLQAHAALRAELMRVFPPSESNACDVHARELAVKAAPVAHWPRLAHATADAHGSSFPVDARAQNRDDVVGTVLEIAQNADARATARLAAIEQQASRFFQRGRRRRLEPNPRAPAAEGIAAAVAGARPHAPTAGTPGLGGDARQDGVDSAGGDRISRWQPKGVYAPQPPDYWSAQAGDWGEDYWGASAVWAASERGVEGVSEAVADALDQEPKKSSRSAPAGSAGRGVSVYGENYGVALYPGAKGDGQASVFFEGEHTAKAASPSSSPKSGRGAKPRSPKASPDVSGAARADSSVNTYSEYSEYSEEEEQEEREAGSDWVGGFSAVLSGLSWTFSSDEDSDAGRKKRAKKGGGGGGRAQERAALAEEKARKEREAKAAKAAAKRAEADAKAAAKRAEAEAKAAARKAEEEARAKKKAEDDAKKKADDEAKAAALARKKAEEEAADAAARARAEAEARARAEAEAEARAREEAEAAARARAEAEARARAEADGDARARAEAEARALAEAEARAREAADAAAKARAAAEARAKEEADAAARAKADADARAREEALTKKEKKADAAARKNAKAEARAKARYDALPGSLVLTQDTWSRVKAEAGEVATVDWAGVERDLHKHLGLTGPNPWAGSGVVVGKFAFMEAIAQSIAPEADRITAWEYLARFAREGSAVRFSAKKLGIARSTGLRSRKTTRAVRTEARRDRVCSLKRTDAWLWGYGWFKWWQALEQRNADEAERALFGRSGLSKTAASRTASFLLSGRPLPDGSTREQRSTRSGTGKFREVASMKKSIRRGSDPTSRSSFRKSVVSGKFSNVHEDPANVHEDPANVHDGAVMQLDGVSNEQASGTHYLRWPSAKKGKSSSLRDGFISSHAGGQGAVQPGILSEIVGADRKGADRNTALVRRLHVERCQGLLERMDALLRGMRERADRVSPLSSPDQVSVAKSAAEKLGALFPVPEWLANPTVDAALHPLLPPRRGYLESGSLEAMCRVGAAVVSELRSRVELSRRQLSASERTKILLEWDVGPESATAAAASCNSSFPHVTWTADQIAIHRFVTKLWKRCWTDVWAAPAVSVKDAPRSVSGEKPQTPPETESSLKVAETRIALAGEHISLWHKGLLMRDSVCSVVSEPPSADGAMWLGPHAQRDHCMLTHVSLSCATLADCTAFRDKFRATASAAADFLGPHAVVTPLRRGEYIDVTLLGGECGRQRASWFSGSAASPQPAPKDSKSNGDESPATRARETDGLDPTDVGEVWVPDGSEMPDETREPGAGSQRTSRKDMEPQQSAIRESGSGPGPKEGSLLDLRGGEEAPSRDAADSPRKIGPKSSLAPFELVGRPPGTVSVSRLTDARLERGTGLRVGAILVEINDVPVSFVCSSPDTCLNDVVRRQRPLKLRFLQDDARALINHAAVMQAIPDTVLWAHGGEAIRAPVLGVTRARGAALTQVALSEAREQRNVVRERWQRAGWFVIRRLRAEKEADAAKSGTNLEPVRETRSGVSAEQEQSNAPVEEERSAPAALAAHLEAAQDDSRNEARAVEKARSFLARFMQRPKLFATALSAPPGSVHDATEKRPFQQRIRAMLSRKRTEATSAAPSTNEAAASAQIASATVMSTEAAQVDGSAIVDVSTTSSHRIEASEILNSAVSGAVQASSAASSTYSEEVASSALPSRSIAASSFLESQDPSSRAVSSFASKKSSRVSKKSTALSRVVSGVVSASAASSFAASASVIPKGSSEEDEEEEDEDVKTATSVMSVLKSAAPSGKKDVDGEKESSVSVMRSVVPSGKAEVDDGEEEEDEDDEAATSSVSVLKSAAPSGKKDVDGEKESDANDVVPSSVSVMKSAVASGKEEVEEEESDESVAEVKRPVPVEPKKRVSLALVKPSEQKISAVEGKPSAEKKELASAAVEAKKEEPPVEEEKKVALDEKQEPPAADKAPVEEKKEDQAFTDEKKKQLLALLGKSKAQKEASGTGAATNQPVGAAPSARNQLLDLLRSKQAVKPEGSLNSAVGPSASDRQDINKTASARDQLALLISQRKPGGLGVSMASPNALAAPGGAAGTAAADKAELVSLLAKLKQPGLEGEEKKRVQTRVAELVAKTKASQGATLGLSSAQSMAGNSALTAEQRAKATQKQVELLNQLRASRAAGPAAGTAAAPGGAPGGPSGAGATPDVPAPSPANLAVEGSHQAVEGSASDASDEEEDSDLDSLASDVNGSRLAASQSAAISKSVSSVKKSRSARKQSSRRSAGRSSRSGAASRSATPSRSLMVSSSLAPPGGGSASNSSAGSAMSGQSSYYSDEEESWTGSSRSRISDVSATMTPAKSGPFAKSALLAPTRSAAPGGSRLLAPGGPSVGGSRGSSRASGSRSMASGSRSMASGSRSMVSGSRSNVSRSATPSLSPSRSILQSILLGSAEISSSVRGAVSSAVSRASRRSRKVEKSRTSTTASSAAQAQSSRASHRSERRSERVGSQKSRSADPQSRGAKTKRQASSSDSFLSSDEIGADSDEEEEPGLSGSGSFDSALYSDSFSDAEWSASIAYPSSVLGASVVAGWSASSVAGGKRGRRGRGSASEAVFSSISNSMDRVQRRLRALQGGGRSATAATAATSSAVHSSSVVESSSMVASSVCSGSSAGAGSSVSSSVSTSRSSSAADSPEVSKSNALLSANWNAAPVAHGKRITVNADGTRRLSGVGGTRGAAVSGSYFQSGVMVGGVQIPTALLSLLKSSARAVGAASVMKRSLEDSTNGSAATEAEENAETRTAADDIDLTPPPLPVDEFLPDELPAANCATIADRGLLVKLPKSGEMLFNAFLFGAHDRAYARVAACAETPATGAVAPFKEAARAFAEHCRGWRVDVGKLYCVTPLRALCCGFSDPLADATIGLPAPAIHDLLVAALLLRRFFPPLVALVRRALSDGALLGKCRRGGSRVSTEDGAADNLLSELPSLAGSFFAAVVTSVHTRCSGACGDGPADTKSGRRRSVAKRSLGGRATARENVPDPAESRGADSSNSPSPFANAHLRQFILFAAAAVRVLREMLPQAAAAALLLPRLTETGEGGVVDIGRADGSGGFFPEDVEESTRNSDRVKAAQRSLFVSFCRDAIRAYRADVPAEILDVDALLAETYPAVQGWRLGGGHDDGLTPASSDPVLRKGGSADEPLCTTALDQALVAMKNALFSRGASDSSARLDIAVAELTDALFLLARSIHGVDTVGPKSGDENARFESAHQERVDQIVRFALVIRQCPLRRVPLDVACPRIVLVGQEAAGPDEPLVVPVRLPLWALDCQASSSDCLTEPRAIFDVFSAVGVDISGRGPGAVICKVRHGSWAQTHNVLVGSRLSKIEFGGSRGIAQGKSPPVSPDRFQSRLLEAQIPCQHVRMQPLRGSFSGALVLGPDEPQFVWHSGEELTGMVRAFRKNSQVRTARRTSDATPAGSASTTFVDFADYKLQTTIAFFSEERMEDQRPDSVDEPGICVHDVQFDVSLGSSARSQTSSRTRVLHGEDGGASAFLAELGLGVLLHWDCGGSLPRLFVQDVKAARASRRRRAAAGPEAETEAPAHYAGLHAGDEITRVGSFAVLAHWRAAQARDFATGANRRARREAKGADTNPDDTYGETEPSDPDLATGFLASLLETSFILRPLTLSVRRVHLLEPGVLVPPAGFSLDELTAA